MVFLPIRKCYHVIKVTFLFLLVIAILALFERWRGGKRGTSASRPFTSEEQEYERQILEDEARIVPGLGEGGEPVYLSGEEKIFGEESERKLAMNVYLSDKISYNRTLKDKRNPACKRVVYDAELPSASVVLIFHNEPYSVVLRTVWSVINSCRRDRPWFRDANFRDAKGRTMKLGYSGQDPDSPFVYLKEIILVDDNSTLPELKGKLSHYVRTRLPPDLIRILRLPERQGLMQARMAGARAARGEALVFLDAHCEGVADWLRPLLQRLRHKRDAVVTPVIDIIDESTFKLESADVFQVGGFTFTGHFTWIDVPEWEKKRRGSDIAPTWSPTMAGGLFAINRAYYWELGAYDEQMAGWGGENLEMSFRIWQCGGTLETVPCSRVGHVFRGFHPYGLPASSDTHGVNTARMAEVWMDEYKELFYLHRPDLRNSPRIGDVTHRRILREKLQCKPFSWYLEHVYKQKFVPVRDAYGFGRFMSGGLCLDTMQRSGPGSALGLYACHAALQATQYLVLSLEHELRGEEDCATPQHKRDDAEGDGLRVTMEPCRGTQQEKKWAYSPETQQLRHSGVGLCLDSAAGSGGDATLRACNPAAPSQRWAIDYSEDNDFQGSSDDFGPKDHLSKLKQLRGQRRISRSLLWAAPPGNATLRRHHKKHKRKAKKPKVKNKFILKLVRALANGSAEHLEVDVHCRHRRLLPNDSFVRDLVSILNDRDIKVINNGRVFERNRVSSLGAERVLAKLEVPPGEPQMPSQPPQDQPSPVKKPRKKPPPPSAAASPPPPMPPSSRGEGAHRIIIEDFVGLAPAHTEPPRTTPAKRTKKRKRLRKRPEAASGQTRAGDQEAHEDLAALLQRELPRPHKDPQFGETLMRQSSLEDAAMAASDNEPRLRTRFHPRGPTDDSAGNNDVYGKRSRETYAKIGPGKHDGYAKNSRESYGKHGYGKNSLENYGKSKHGSAKSGREDDPSRHSSERRGVEPDGNSLEGKVPDGSPERTRHLPRGKDGHSDEENWPIGESRFRRNNTSWRRHKADDDEPLGGAAPVKVVMRSNLTFNLGDEFFTWRRHGADSVTELPQASRPAPLTPLTPLTPPAPREPEPRAGPDSADDDSASDSNSSDK